MARRKVNKEDMAAKRAIFKNIAAQIEEVPADEFLKNNFLPYAWSFTLNRALTDVSGLKPVQRRILYTMFKRGLSPSAARQKVATLGGAVLAIHPHGNTAVEEALKNLGRDHIFRVPLIDGKGDFGSPGAPGAAARYLEARLNKAAWINLEELSENAVAMVPSYDNNTTEPVRIPVRWPVALINGGAGIAVGYSSNMPSHNPTEIMKAAKMLLRNPDASYKEIHKIIKGPDFNMGGIITSNDGVKEYLETGRGTFKIRGEYTVEHLPRRKSRIEFHEIPFGAYPEKIVEEIQKGSEKGLFKEIVSYKDLSDLKHPTRVVIETRPGVQYQKVLSDLFSSTSLESSFAANITTVVNNRPLQAGIRELLLDFINFRKECVVNKLTYQKEKKEARAHLIEGLLKVLLDIDTAIAIIRRSTDAEDALSRLQKKFKITEEQATYVLSLQLRRLTKMDSLSLKNEGKELKKEISEINKVLTKESALIDYLDAEFDDTLSVIKSPRKTKVFNGSLKDFASAEQKEIKELSDSTKEQDCYITRFANGRIMKSLTPFVYKTSASYKFGPIIDTIKSNTMAEIVLVSNKGEGFKIPMSFLPLDKPVSPKQAGAPITEKEFVGIALLKGFGLAMMTANGLTKISKPDFPSRENFTVINLEPGDSIVNTSWISEADTRLVFVSITANGMVASFDSSTVRASGSNAAGIAGMKLKDKDKVISFSVIKDRKNAAIISQGFASIKATPLMDIAIKGRNGMGVILQDFGKERKGLKAAYVGVNPIMTLDADGGKTPISVPPLTKRASKGTDFNLPVLMGSLDASI